MPLLYMQVGKPGRPSGCFGRDGEYALYKAAVSQLEANHVLMATLRWQSRGMRLGNIRSAYAIRLGGCCDSPMQCLILSRCEEPRCLRSRASRELSSSFSHAPLAIFRRQLKSGVRCPDLGALLVDLPLRPEEEIERRCMNRMVDPSEYASHPSILCLQEVRCLARRCPRLILAPSPNSGLSFEIEVCQSLSLFKHPV